MAARKLQGEIDRTLKKVTEGVELFESIYDKMQSSTNQTQKEKLETDLKTQIKKLQRMRDQIKTWVASNDIKDKSQLLEYRKLIETQMEKFKACEKEMKTKAFSKEGLTQASKLDPKAQEKLETTQWLQSRVEELLLQVEQSEAQIETLQGGTKKKKSGNANSRLEEMEHLNERRKWHVGRLEIVLRLLDNGSLPVEKVNALKEDVSYFVDSNTDDDFDEYEGVYDELDLDAYGLLADDNDSDSESDAESEDLVVSSIKTPKKQQQQQDDEPSKHKQEENSPILKKIGATLQARKSLSEGSSKLPNPNFVAQPMSSIVKNGLPPKPPAALPVQYAAAAAAAVNVNSTVAATSTMPATVITPSTSANNVSAPPVSSASNGTITSLSSMSVSTTQSSQDHASSSPSLTHPSVSAQSPLLSSVASALGQAADESVASRLQSPAVSEAVPSSIAASHAMSSPELTKAQTAANSLSPEIKLKNLTLSDAPDDSPQIIHPPEQPTVPQTQPPQSPFIPNVQQQQQQQQIPLSLQPQSTSTPAPGAIPSTIQQPPYPPGVIKMPQGIEQHLGSSGTSLPPPPGVSTINLQQNFGAPIQQQRGPGSLSDLLLSFEDVKQKAPHRMANLDHVHKLLEGSYSGMPQPQDTDKPKYYVPKNPFQTAPYYPQTPSLPLNSPALFSQLDIETLFYVFYYLPGTYQQYLAAKELKRQSWRFHVKYLTWFQRHSEPQAITEEYEQGVYVYFDWEGSWCQRKKSDFRFEYRYLSEE